MSRRTRSDAGTGEVLELTRMTKKGIQALCKKNKLYQTPELNDVLYLHYQGYRDIECLEEYTGLKCLWLENNAISEIAGLDNQKQLKCLFLNNNLIKKIENLENCPELDTLNLANNHISRIENCGVDKLPVLTTLILSHNYIRTAEQLEQVVNCKMLSVLDLAHNRIEDILVVKIFAQIPDLRVLDLDGNPVINKIPQYRKTLILECKNLTHLDRRPVFPKDRACAEAWKRGGYEEERREHSRWNKAERRKIRESVNATLRLRNRGGGDPQVELIASSSDEDDTERSSAPPKEDDETQPVADTLSSDETVQYVEYYDPESVPQRKPSREIRKCQICGRVECNYVHIEQRSPDSKVIEDPESILESTKFFQEEHIPESNIECKEEVANDPEDNSYSNTENNARNLEESDESSPDDNDNQHNPHKDDLYEKAFVNYLDTVDRLIYIESKIEAENSARDNLSKNSSDSNITTSHDIKEESVTENKTKVKSIKEAGNVYGMLSDELDGKCADGGGNARISPRSESVEAQNRFLRKARLDNFPFHEVGGQGELTPEQTASIDETAQNILNQPKGEHSGSQVSEISIEPSAVDEKQSIANSIDQSLDDQQKSAVKFIVDSDREAGYNERHPEAALMPNIGKIPQSSEKKKQVTIIAESEVNQERMKIPTTPIPCRKGRKIDWSRIQEKSKRTKIDRDNSMEGMLDIFAEWSLHPLEEESNIQNACSRPTVDNEDKEAPLVEENGLSSTLNESAMNTVSPPECTVLSPIPQHIMCSPILEHSSRNSSPEDSDELIQDENANLERKEEDSLDSSSETGGENNNYDNNVGVPVTTIRDFVSSYDAFLHSIEGRVQDLSLRCKTSCVPLKYLKEQPVEECISAVLDTKSEASDKATGGILNEEYCEEETLSQENERDQNKDRNYEERFLGKESENCSEEHWNMFDSLKVTGIEVTSVLDIQERQNLECDYKLESEQSSITVDREQKVEVSHITSIERNVDSDTNLELNEDICAEKSNSCQSEHLNERKVSVFGNRSVPLQSCGYYTDKGRRNSEIISRLLKSPLTKAITAGGIQKNLEDTTEELLSMSAVQKAKQIKDAQDTVHTVYSQKQEYEGSLEIIDNKLVIIPKRTLDEKDFDENVEARDFSESNKVAVSSDVDYQSASEIILKSSTEQVDCHEILRTQPGGSIYLEGLKETDIVEEYQRVVDFENFNCISSQKPTDSNLNITERKEDKFAKLHTEDVIEMTISSLTQSNEDSAEIYQEALSSYVISETSDGPEIFESALDELNPNNEVILNSIAEQPTPRYDFTDIPQDTLISKSNSSCDVQYDTTIETLTISSSCWDEKDAPDDSVEKYNTRDIQEMREHQSCEGLDPLQGMCLEQYETTERNSKHISMSSSDNSDLEEEDSESHPVDVCFTLDKGRYTI
ncbi:unnamed protein product [Hermetia illucens]|uniref:Dynein axonemal assembly factor 1 homolog n=1 Tax=Hermetia illucens TaxID=343691 RepID=A0A7R8URH6_HERIL|nr:uncharacterized protein LOC119651720 [Hermetia illucens]CAD7085677.1 unnamed protein product [Hermetia illucens]